MPAPTTTGGSLMGYPSSIDSGQVQPWMLNENIHSGAASGTLVANTVYLYAIEIIANVTITGMKIRTGTTVTGTCDQGIYDGAGNLLAHTGTFTPGNNVVTTTNFATALPVGQGRYYLATCPSNSTDTYFKETATSGLVPALIATNAGTAGVLPATTGGGAATGTMVSATAVISGGLA